MIQPQVKRKKKERQSCWNYKPSSHLSKLPTLGNLKLRISGHVSNSASTFLIIGYDLSTSHRAYSF